MPEKSYKKKHMTSFQLIIMGFALEATGPWQARRSFLHSYKQVGLE